MQTVVSTLKRAVKNAMDFGLFYMTVWVLFMNIVLVGGFSFVIGLVLFGFQIGALQYAGWIILFSILISSVPFCTMIWYPQADFPTIFLIEGLIGGIAGSVVALSYHLWNLPYIANPLGLAFFVAIYALLVTCYFSIRILLHR